MDSAHCTSCFQEGTLIEDHTEGSIVCKACGVVQESRIIDESSEWRNFSDKGDGTEDKSRVGGAGNPLFESKGELQKTGILSKSATGQVVGLSGGLARVQAKSGGSDRAMIHARNLASLCERLQLHSGVTMRAQELLLSIREARGNIGLSGMAGKTGIEAVLAGCVFAACKLAGVARTIREVTAVCESATLKNVGRGYKTVLKTVDQSILEQLNKTEYAASSHVLRFASLLALSRDASRAARVATDGVASLFNTKDSLRKSGRSPVSLAAAGIYTIALLDSKHDGITAESVAQVTGVAELTIRAVYREIHPYIHEIIPDWYMSAKDVAEKLPPP